MEVTNRKILLIDNAPSHTRGDLDLTKIEHLTLPPNTTSKIQPMDAGTITAFKRRYRQYQLQDALKKEERNEVDIYRVDQLTAMRWTKAACINISAEIVANRFRHTALFNVQENNAHAEAEIEEEVEKILVDVTAQPPIAILMSMTALLSPIEEQQIVHRELSEKVVLELADMEDEEVDASDEAIDEPKIFKEGESSCPPKYN